MCLIYHNRINFNSLSFGRWYWRHCLCDFWYDWTCSRGIMMTAKYKILKTFIQNCWVVWIAKKGGIAEYLQLHQKQCRRGRNMQTFRLNSWQVSSYYCMIISKMNPLNTIFQLDIILGSIWLNNLHVWKTAGNVSKVCQSAKM